MSIVEVRQKTGRKAALSLDSFYVRHDDVIFEMAFHGHVDAATMN